MDTSTARKRKVTSYSFNNNCGLPMSLLAIIFDFATERALELPRSLTERYMNCTGLGSKLLNNEWGDYIVEFPWLLAILVCSACLPLICIAWAVFQFRPHRVRRFEGSHVSNWRHLLSTLLFLLKIVYCFFLWFTYTSFANHPQRNTRDGNENLVNIFYDQTLNVVDDIFVDNDDAMPEFMKHLASELVADLRDSAPKIFQDPSDSMLEQLNADSNTTQQHIKRMRTDVQYLMADLMQLLDFTRFFYRNTTTFLNTGNVSDEIYVNRIHNELKANEHKIIMALSIEQVLLNIEDIIEMSVEFPRLRKTFNKSLEELYSYYVQYITSVWISKAKQLSESRVEMTKAVEQLKTNLPRNVMIHLPSDIYSYQLLFLTIASLIAILCFMQLLYAVYHTVAMRFKKKKYILVSIVVVICISSTVLCMIASLSFFVGTSYFNFRQETEDLRDPCGLDTQPYCDAHNSFITILNTDKDTFKRDMLVQNQRVFEALRSALPSVAGISNILHMQQYVDFSGFVFNAGAMFNVVKQEFNMDNWYGAYERLSSHITNKNTTAKSESNISARYQTMLACNLNTVKSQVFDILVAKKITENVNELAKNAAHLAARLPMQDLSAILKKSLSEMRELHDFFETDLQPLLIYKTNELLNNFEQEMIAYRNRLAWIPSCMDLKLPSIGMPRDLYECIEHRLHGFWIGAFAILILLFPILIICMILAFIYDRYPYTTQSARSSRSSQPSDESSSTGSTTTGGNASADDESVSEPEAPRKLNWRDKFGPRVKKSHVTFNTAPKRTKKATSALDKLTNTRRSSTAKIRDLIYSVIHSAPSEPQEETSSTTKSSVNASTTEEEEEKASEEV